MGKNINRYFIEKENENKLTKNAMFIVISNEPKAIKTMRYNFTTKRLAKN